MFSQRLNKPKIAKLGRLSVTFEQGNFTPLTAGPVYLT
jgi:hypothetical protein